MAGASDIKPPLNIEYWTRITPGLEYIKLCVSDGRVVGAMLIGDTDLEEVCENLILNKLDVSGLGISMLDPDLDLGDYFD
jgi:pyridine nucleotide-disulfide oxidoreductase domain-containing protein 1